MMIWLSLLFFIIAVAMICVARKTQIRTFVGAITATQVTMAVYYGFVPAALFLFNDYYQANPERWGYEDINQFVFQKPLDSFLFAFCLIFIGFFTVIVAKFVYETYINKRLIRSMGIKNEKFILSLNKVICGMSYFTLILGSFSLIIVFIGAGGIVKALRLGEVLRGFSTNPADHMHPVVSLFRVPAKLVLVSSMLFLYQLFERRCDRHLFFLFIVSVLFSVLYLMLNAGRSTLIIYFFLLAYPFLREKIKYFWTFLLCLAIIGSPFLIILDDAFKALSTGGTLHFELRISTYLDALIQFSHPIKILLNVREIVERYGLMFFKNVVTDIISLLPGVSFEQSFYDTSEFLRGSNWRALGGVPNDIISYGYLNLRVIGVFLSCSVWSAIGSWLDVYICRIANSKQRNLLGMMVASSFFGLVINADLQSTLQSDVYLMTLSFIIIITLIIETMNKNKSKVSK